MPKGFTAKKRPVSDREKSGCFQAFFNLNRMAPNTESEGAMDGGGMGVVALYLLIFVAFLWCRKKS